MKKVIITLAFAITSLYSNAQLVVKEQAKDTVIWQSSKMTTVPKIIKFTIDSLDSYTMYYRNAKYSQITDIDYLTTGDKETSIQFYELCKTVMDSGKEFTIEIDGKTFLLSKGSMGTVMIWSENSYFYLSSKQLNSILETIK